IWNTFLSLSGLWRKRYAVLKESYKLYRRKILTVCKTSLPRNRIISFLEESGQGQVLEMGMNLSGAVIRNSQDITTSYLQFIS
ncbi:MAG: hypothetical protein ABRQ38_25605, partial [Candidatus Eremiobacterota bacterium]